MSNIKLFAHQTFLSVSLVSAGVVAVYFHSATQPAKKTPINKRRRTNKNASCTAMVQYPSSPRWSSKFGTSGSNGCSSVFSGPINAAKKSNDPDVISCLFFVVALLSSVNPVGFTDPFSTTHDGECPSDLTLVWWKWCDVLDKLVDDFRIHFYWCGVTTFRLN